MAIKNYEEVFTYDLKLVKVGLSFTLIATPIFLITLLISLGYCKHKEDESESNFDDIDDETEKEYTQFVDSKLDKMRRRMKADIIARLKNES
jgi:hypothetical protein